MTSPQFTFSVAVATYNRADLIGETLDRILNQSFEPAEVVLVDDGSTDRTEAAINAIGDRRIRYVRIENAGPGAALKHAIDLCESPWIAMCDDDDLWELNHLQRKVELLSRYPDVDFTFSNFTAFGPAAHEGYRHFDDTPDGWWEQFSPIDADGFQYMGANLFPYFVEVNPVFPFTSCFTRDLWERCGGIDPKFSRLGCWDAHMIWRFTLHGIAASDHELTAARRQHGSNFSTKRSQVQLQRSYMLETAWDDGWIPRQYEALIREMSVAAKKRSASWAWRQDDYEMLRVAVDSLPRSEWSRDVYRYLLGAYLPGFVRAVRAGARRLRGAARSHRQ